MFAGYEVVLVTELATNVFTIIRGLSTGIYTTSSPDNCCYVLKNSKATIVVVEDYKFLNKIVEVCVITYICTVMLQLSNPK